MSEHPLESKLAEWIAWKYPEAAPLPAKPTAHPSDAEAAHTAEIASTLRRNGRPDSDAGRIAAGLRRAHDRHHSEPRAKCVYCPDVPRGWDQAHVDSFLASFDDD
jgi:hypothetical protein